MNSKETEFERRYRREGFSKGLTVAEWEESEGLPRYTVCPEAARAAGPDDHGWFMYRATKEPTG